MGVKCEINFTDNPLGIFYAGQTIVGKVDFSIDRTFKTTGELNFIYLQEFLHKYVLKLLLFW